MPTTTSTSAATPTCNPDARTLAALGDLREFLRAAHPGFPQVFVLEKRPRRNDAKAGPVKTNNGYGLRGFRDQANHMMGKPLII